MNHRPCKGLTKQENERLAAVHPLLPSCAHDLHTGGISRRSFVKTAVLLGLSLGAAGSVVERLTGYRAIAPARAGGFFPNSKDNTLRISMIIREVEDPALADWSQKGNVARPVLESLVRIGSDSIARPLLAESWHASPDLKTWTFFLRKGVKWSNGDDFEADDVIFNFTRWLDPALGSSNLSRFSSMTEKFGGKDRMIPAAIQKLDDHTVRFNLRVPDLVFPYSAGDYPTLLVNKNFEKEGGNFMLKPVGTGPFMLDEIRVRERATFSKRNPERYWGPEVKLDGVDIFDHGEENTAWLNALISGEVDLLYELAIEQVALAREVPELRVYDVRTGQTGVARMKITEPPFDNKLLRQAIQNSVDCEQILALSYQGLGVSAEHHHVGPVHPDYCPGCSAGATDHCSVAFPKQDYPLARQLLAQAGYSDGIKLTIDVVNHPSWEANACLAIKEHLKPVGIDLTVNRLPGDVYWDNWDRAPFGFTAWTHRPLGVQVLNLAYRSSGVWNETSYNNPEFDQALDQASSTLDVDQRREIMCTVERFLRNDAILVQPLWRSIFTASNQRVQDFHLHPANEFHLEQVWLS